MIMNLKPCPFCGGEADYKIADISLNQTGHGTVMVDVSIGCKPCGYSMDSKVAVRFYDSKLSFDSTGWDKLVDRWNTRTITQSHALPARGRAEK